MTVRDASSDDVPETILPLAEVHLPTLDEWTDEGQRRIGEGWIAWTAPDREHRVDVEARDLEVPPDRATYGFEVELAAVDERPHDTILRETIHNSRVAAYTAEFVARHAETFVDEWDEGLAPRPEDVGTLDPGPGPE